VFGIFEILWLVFRGLRRCTNCGAILWIGEPPRRREIRVGKEEYVCKCGARYPTGCKEWVHLTARQQHDYFWSLTVLVPASTTTLAAIAGYLVRWHEPYWLMSAFFGALGLFAGMLCSSFLWLKRWMSIRASVHRTGRLEPINDNFQDLTNEDKLHSWQTRKN
jgi:hypothetical protein